MNTIHRKVIGFLWLSFLTSACEPPTEIAEGPKVHTSVGTVKGYYKNSTRGRIYEAFEGIPYAEPPVGKLRFQPPEKVRPWFGEFPAIKYSASCLQYVDQINKTSSSSNIKGDEDCLYLNIYSPKRKENVNSKQKLLPVIFWIHGGMFQRGSGNLASASHLMDYDVILVTFNYRLGPLGFLSTEDSSIPGNMGLKDQNAALRWIHDNVKFFGGDSKQITLIGLNAGGASVHYHYLSPLSIDLFQGGISLSGTAFNFWAQKKNSKETTKEFATTLGCPDETSKMIECLKSRPSHTLINTAGKFMQSMSYSYAPFGPVIEKRGNNSFIDDSPLAIINSGKCQKKPWITGVINEGLYPASEIIANSKCLGKLDQQWTEIAPRLMGFNETSIPIQKQNETALKIKKQYFGSQHINQNTSNIFLKMMEDRLFAVDSVKAAKLQAKVNKNNVWYYSFSYKEIHETNDFMYHKNLGICLSEETNYIFEEQEVTGSLTNKSYQMQQEIIEFWISFAYKKIPHFGKMTWPAVDLSKSKLMYLHIDGPGLYNVSKKNDNFGNEKFWNSIEFGETHDKHHNSTMNNKLVGESIEWKRSMHNSSQVTLNETSNILKEQQLSAHSYNCTNTPTIQNVTKGANINSTEKNHHQSKLNSTNYKKREIPQDSIIPTNNNNNQSSNGADKHRQIISNWLTTYMQHGRSNVSNFNGFFKYNNSTSHNATDNEKSSEAQEVKYDLRLNTTTKDGLNDSHNSQKNNSSQKEIKNKKSNDAQGIKYDLRFNTTKDGLNDSHNSQKNNSSHNATDNKKSSQAQEVKYDLRFNTTKDELNNSHNFQKNNSSQKEIKIKQSSMAQGIKYDLRLNTTTKDGFNDSHNSQKNNSSWKEIKNKKSNDAQEVKYDLRFNTTKDELNDSHNSQKINETVA